MTITIQRPKLTKYQKDILYSDSRFTVTEASTKVGKTFSHLFWIFELAHTPPKKGANYWWVAPVYSQAKIAFTRMRRTISGNSAYRINESDLFIVTPLGSTIWFKSAEKPDNLYGEDVYGAVFDEFTRAREEAWHALRSTLTHTKGKCKFIGNVRGKSNWGYRLGVKAKTGEPGYSYFKLTAWDAVKAGILSKDEVEQAQRDLPDKAFRQLYLGEAFDDEANPFGIDFIRNAIRPLSNKPVVCYGVDLAKSVDFTVIVGLDATGQISYYNRFQKDWAQTTQTVIDVIKQTPANIDSTGVGDSIFEAISKHCHKAISFKFTSTSKQQIMEGLAASIQKGKITVLGNEMKDELEAFEFQYTRTGVRYSAPDGIHDDTVCALALANELLPHSELKASARSYDKVKSSKKRDYYKDFL
jgi:phage FluMu gp28-like protein